MDTGILSIFVDVIRQGSFASVARDRGIDPSSVSRAISTLESELKIRLLQRTTRKLTPTEAGAIYYERIAPLMNELATASIEASDLLRQPSGTLRITTPVGFGQVCLIPLLPEIASIYPGLSFDIVLSDVSLDLLSERIDVAVRLGPIVDSSFIAKKLCPLTPIVCANPDYLNRLNHPEKPEDLISHNCLLFPTPVWSSLWRFRGRTGHITEVPVQGNCTISSGLSLRDCALAGMGVTLLPFWIVSDLLQKGSLVNLFPDYAVTATVFDEAAWLIYPSRSYLPLKVRVFLDFMKQKAIENFKTKPFKE